VKDPAEKLALSSLSELKLAEELGSIAEACRCSPIFGSQVALDARKCQCGIIGRLPGGVPKKI